jgi:hypothetical protein
VDRIILDDFMSALDHVVEAADVSEVGRSHMSTEIRDLIRRMSLANPLWGAPRIHGELLKLGIDVSQATVGRSLLWPKVPSPPVAFCTTT